MSECVCAECGPCRRSLRESAYAPPRPVTLSEKAREILAEPVGTPYRPGPRLVRTKSEKTATDPRPSKQPINRRKGKPPQPDCADCGQTVGLRAQGYEGRGWALTGRDGLCEVCADKQWVAEMLAAPIPSPQTPAIKQKLSKARKFGARILVDGRAYNPTAPEHGTSTVYNNYGCRCTTPNGCLAWKTRDNANRRATKAAA